MKRSFYLFAAVLLVVALPGCGPDTSKWGGPHSPTVFGLG